MPLLVKLYIRLSTINICFSFSILLSTGYLCHKVHSKKGEYEGPCRLAIVMQTLATCLCCWYGCDVVAHMEARLPQMAAAIWGNHRGCFEKPCPGRAPQVQICCSLEIVYCTSPYFYLFTMKKCAFQYTEIWKNTSGKVEFQKGFYRFLKSRNIISLTRKSHETARFFVGNVYEKAHELQYFRNMKAHVSCVHFLAVKQSRKLLLS